MACCTRYCAGETQFDSKVAQRDLRRYRRRGADATTRLMLAELRRWPLEGQQLLDVGGGIGVISAELAGTGWPLWAGLWVGKGPRTPKQPHIHFPYNLSANDRRSRARRQVVLQGKRIGLVSPFLAHHAEKTYDLQHTDSVQGIRQTTPVS